MIRDSARSGSFDREQFARLRAAERCRHSDRKERSALSPDHGCRSCHRTNRQWSRTQIAEMTESCASWGDSYCDENLPFTRNGGMFCFQRSRVVWNVTFGRCEGVSPVRIARV